MTKNSSLQFGAGFYQLKNDPSVRQIRILNQHGVEIHCIQNRKGETASLLIYAKLADEFAGRLNPACARYGLNLYGDYVTEELENPNSHANIRRLISIAETDQRLTLVVDR